MRAPCERTTSTRDDPGVDVLIEGFDADAVALARLLAGEGNAVRLASPEPEPAEARELRELGIDVQPGVDLDADPGEAEIAYLDVWTPEVAPRVGLLRARGARVSCLGDLLLERWAGPTIGITGTAGKTTTTALIAAILRNAGMDIAVSTGARAGNLWPTADLLERDRRRGERAKDDAPPRADELPPRLHAFEPQPRSGDLLLARSPGAPRQPRSVPRREGADRAPPEAGDRVVVNADDAAAGFAEATPADVWELSVAHRVERGAYLDQERGVVVADGTTETGLGHIEARSPSRQRRRSGSDRDRSRCRSVGDRAGVDRPSPRPGARSRAARSAAFPSSTTAWPRRRQGSRDARPLPGGQHRAHRRRPGRCRRGQRARDSGRDRAPRAGM